MVMIHIVSPLIHCIVIYTVAIRHNIRIIKGPPLVQVKAGFLHFGHEHKSDSSSTAITDIQTRMPTTFPFAFLDQFCHTAVSTLQKLLKPSTWPSINSCI